MELYEAARRYVGTPWLDQGRTRKGLDCVGFIICSIRDAYEIEIDPKRTLHRHMPVGDFVKATAKHWIRVAKQDARPNDVVAMGRTDVTLLAILAPGAPLNMISLPLKGEVQEGPCSLDRPIRGVFRCRS